MRRELFHLSFQRVGRWSWREYVPCTRRRSQSQQILSAAQQPYKNKNDCSCEHGSHYCFHIALRAKVLHLWSWRESNPRPNVDHISFLHPYRYEDCRDKLRRNATSAYPYPLCLRQWPGKPLPQPDLFDVPFRSYRFGPSGTAHYEIYRLGSQCEVVSVAT